MQTKFDDRTDNARNSCCDEYLSYTVTMKHIVVGLGNPGPEYEHTRHNVGRMVVEAVHDLLDASDWRDDAKLRARVSTAALDTGDIVMLVLPDNYMNRSGGSVAPLITGAKQAERLVVVHDDIDLPVGTVRIVFNRGAGGHRGVESIVRAIKTRAFARVRVGVVPVAPSGKLRKPAADDKVHDLILKKLSTKDREYIATCIAHVARAVEMLLLQGRTAAMQQYNGQMEEVRRKLARAARG